MILPGALKLKGKIQNVDSAFHLRLESQVLGSVFSLNGKTSIPSVFEILRLFNRRVQICLRVWYVAELD